MKHLDDQIERVARAMARHDLGPLYGLKYWEEYQRLAQVALDAAYAWQPIETAPKDGTPIFALCFEDYPQVVVWDQEIDYGDEGVRQIWRSQLEGFVIPTYWMPLPPAPEEE